MNMEINEFLNLPADQLNKYITSKIPNFEFFRNRIENGSSPYDLLDIPGLKFKELRRLKGRKVIKKLDMRWGGLGNITFTLDLDLNFYDIYGKHIGDFWRYGDGSSSFSAIIDGGKSRKPASSILEMLKLALNDDTI